MLRRNDAATDPNAKFPSSHSPSTPKDTPQLTTILDLNAFGSITVGSISTDGSIKENCCEDAVTIDLEHQ